MFKLLIVFLISLLLAYVSEHNTKAILASGEQYTVWKDWAYLLLVAVLVLFTGLRTNYNDTWNYTNSFRSAGTLTQFFNSPNAWNLFKNPLFFFVRAALKTVTDNAQWLVFLTSATTQICYLRFFKRYSTHFLFSVFIYFTLGTFVFTLAAMKQVVAMGVVTLAFPYLEKKQWVRYYLLVFAAMLIHTYAIAFAVLPFFSVRPWGLFTFLFVAIMAVLMLNFEETITAFMEQANDLGKTLADYEVFDSNTVNIFRLAVYAVLPTATLLFRKWFFHDSTQMDYILVHMSIISLAFMVMGTQSGANMFARMATYFELGTICVLPRILEKTFDRRSYSLVSRVAVVCFFLFFVYANAVGGNFDQEYRWIFD